MPTSTKSKTRQRAEARRAALKEELAQVAIVIKVDQRREQEQRRQLRNRQDRIIGAWFRSRQTGPQQHSRDDRRPGRIPLPTITTAARSTWPRFHPPPPTRRTDK